MGTGMSSVKPGDCVCIIFGGITPFILRKEGEYYKLIGESYVHGLMKGEAIDENLSRVCVECFEIR